MPRASARAVCASIGVYMLATVIWLLRLIFRAVRPKPDPVIGSELDSSWEAVKRWHEEQANALSGPTQRRANAGQFAAGNLPPNIGSSKQRARLTAAGLETLAQVWDHPAYPNLSSIEARVLIKRWRGRSFNAVARMLRISVSQARRAEKSAVDKILATRKEPS